MALTSIEWTATLAPDGKLRAGYTFNPWWGCIRVSPGCEHCYAESQAKRYGHDIWGPASTTPRRFFGDKHWSEPLKWNRDALALGMRLKVFCASFADVFEDNDSLIPHRERLWEVIAETPQLDWLVLTKRTENIREMMPDRFWPNVWLGTSAENQHYYNTRVPILIENTSRVPVLFVSAEPLLGPIDLGAGFDLWCGPCHPARGRDIPAFCTEAYAKGVYDPITGRVNHNLPDNSACREPIVDYVDWIIAGGESGPRHRPFDLQWVRDMRDVCETAGKAFFFKQHGGRTHAEGGCLIDGLEVKEFPRPRLALELARA
jgi:protein gp37